MNSQPVLDESRAGFCVSDRWECFVLARSDVIATLFDMVGSIFDNIPKGRAELNVMTQRELLASTEMTAERHG